MRRRIETRREHQVIAARQIAHAGAVLIHDGEALHAPILRAGFVHEYDAAVEIAFLAGHALVDRVRNDVRDAPPIIGRREILLPIELLAGKHIPKAKLGLQPAIALARDAAGDQRLGVDRAPVREARNVVAVGDLFDERRRTDRREQAAALKIVGDNGGDVAARVGI